MLLSLEVLQGKHGDCLLLHYGKNEDPKVMVIDGGPSGIYNRVLKPRLMELKQSRSLEEPLPISMVMVSHADDDHINGIVMLTNELVSKMENQETQDFAIDNFWFNSFDDIIGNIQIPAVSAISASSQPAGISSLNAPLLTQAAEHIQAVIASTGQGRQIRNNADKLTLPVNAPFEALGPGKANLVRGDVEEAAIVLENLKITVIHPNDQRLKELQKQWDEDLRKAKEKGDNDIIFAAITSLDKSPFNLSSIVCMVEMQDKKILLTGDARSDDILDGLENNGLLDVDGKLHVDILKVQHHASKANMTPEFLQRVTADHYVVSADGAHSNPDQETLDMIRENVKQGNLHFTNRVGKLDLQQKMDGFVQELKNTGHKLKVHFRDEEAPSFILNLLDEIDF